MESAALLTRRKSFLARGTRREREEGELWKRKGESSEEYIEASRAQKSRLKDKTETEKDPKFDALTALSVC